MQDTPTGRANGSIGKTPRKFAQLASVNTIVGRGVNQTTEQQSRRRKIHQRATFTNPPEQAVATKIRGADGSSSEEIQQIKPGPEFKHGERSPRRSNSKPMFRTTKGASIEVKGWSYDQSESVASAIPSKRVCQTLHICAG